MYVCLVECRRGRAGENWTCLQCGRLPHGCRLDPRANKEARAMIISLATVICFATYVGLWGYVCGAHLLAFQRHKENFWLSIRVPEMLVAEVVVQFLMGVSCALRQISAESGFEIPCYLMNLVSCLAATLIPYTHAYRAVKAIIVYNHQWRKKYLRYFHARAAQKHIAAVASFGLVVWGASTPFTCCKTNCNISNCFLFSSYYLLLPVGMAVGLLLLTLIYIIYHYDVKDATGCLDELMQITGVLFLVFMPYIGILVVMDWGKVEGYEWERLATGLLLLCAALNLYFGVVAPAVKYGYDPFSKHLGSVMPEEDLPGGLELGMGGMWALQRLLHSGGGNSNTTTMTNTANSVQSQSLAVTGMNFSEAASVHQNARAIEFDEMLCTPEIKEAFLAYCSRHMCYEHIMFIIDVEELMCQPTDTREQRDTQRKRLLEIAERYIRFGSTHDLGLNYRLANAVIRQLQLFKRRNVVFLDEYRAYTQAIELIQRRIKKKLVGTVFSQFRRTTGNHFFALDHSLGGGPLATVPEGRTNPIHSSSGGAGSDHASSGGGGSGGASGESRAYHQPRAAVDQPQDDLVVPFVTDTLNLDDEEEDGPRAKPKTKQPGNSLGSSVRAIFNTSLRASQLEKQPLPAVEASPRPLQTPRQDPPPPAQAFPPPHIDTQDRQAPPPSEQLPVVQTSVFRQVRAAASSLVRWGRTGGQEAKTLPLASTRLHSGTPTSPSPVISPDVTLRRTGQGGNGEASSEDVVRILSKTGSMGVVAFDSDMGSEPKQQTSRVQFI